MKPLIPTPLCTRCGACYAADRDGVLVKDPLGYPVVKADTKPTEVERLRAVCTGENWAYRALLDATHGEDYAYDPSSADKGQVLRLGIAYSRREDLVSRGQSGGVTTSIVAAALGSGLIDSFLAVRRPQQAGEAFRSEPFIVRSIDELGAAAGSKYTICPSLEMVPELERDSRAYAVSLLPCQTAGLRKMQAEGLVSPEKCRLVVGPFCGFNMEQRVGSELARRLGLDPGRVVEFGNRKGEFPGETFFRTADGEVRTLDRTAHRALYRIFTPTRCLTCTDFTNELADLSIADCWIPDDGGGFRYPQGAAWILVRTERGRRFVENAVESGFLEFEETPTDANDRHWKESILHRKVRAFNRVHLFRREGVPVPEFDHDVPGPRNPYFAIDRGEHRIRRWLQHPWLGRRFLDWWVRVHAGTAGPFGQAAKKYLGSKVFTHRSDADRPGRALRRLSVLFLKKNRLVRLLLGRSR